MVTNMVMLLPIIVLVVIVLVVILRAAGLHRARHLRAS